VVTGSRDLYRTGHPTRDGGQYYIGRGKEYRTAELQQTRKHKITTGTETRLLYIIQTVVRQQKVQTDTVAVGGSAKKKKKNNIIINNTKRVYIYNIL